MDGRLPAARLLGLVLEFSAVVVLVMFVLVGMVDAGEEGQAALAEVKVLDGVRPDPVPACPADTLPSPGLAVVDLGAAAVACILEAPP